MHPTTTKSSMPLPVLPTDALPKIYVARLFERLAGQLGGKIGDLYAGLSPDVVHFEWASGLAGFSKAELKRGIAACQHRKFAPNLGEFTHLCRPVLEPEIAWEEAVIGLREREMGLAGTWSHPAVWRAAAAMGYEVRTSNFRACRTRWSYRLGLEFEAGWGLGFPDAIKCIAMNDSTRRADPDFLKKLKAGGFRVGSA